MKAIAQNGQTLIDMAVQYTGGIDSVFDILDSNPLLVMDMSIAGGTVVIIPDRVINKAVVQYYADNDIVPMSGLGEDQVITQNDMNTIKQDTNYSLAGGDKEFDRVQLYFLRDLLTVQVRYTGVTADTVEFAVDQSLDGENWSQIPYCSYTLDKTKDTHTFNIVGIVTGFVRGHIRVPDASAGTIDHITFMT